MAHRLRPNAPLTGLVLALAACSGSSSNNAAPSFGTIPQQRVAGGTTFTLDLEPYVQDREDADATMSYSVVSGGGSIALGTPSGGVTPVNYTNDFDTLGNYTVLVRATDAGGKSTDTSFDVEVTSARLAAVQQNTSGLLLLDVDTNATVQVVSGGNQPTYVGGTPLGCAIYQIGTGANKQLWIYDLVTRSSRRIATDKTWVNYVAQTSTGRIVFTSGPSSDTDLWIYNPSTGFTTEISAQAGEIDGSAVITTDDLVFYERGNSGQSDVWYFDPTLGTSTSVATASSNEVIRGALENGAVLFTRIGGGGETDLYYVSLATGVLEVGSDLGTTEQSQSKTYAGATSDNKIVFELAAVSGTDLYVWNSTSGTTRAIATNSEEDRFEGVTESDVIVYRREFSSTNHDLYVYTWAGNASTAVAVTNDRENYLASLSTGDFVYERFVNGDQSMDIVVYSVTGASIAALGETGADDFTFQAVLSDDTVVYLHETSTPVLYAHPSSGPAVAVATGNAPVFKQETTGGDFVYETTNAGNTNVYLWDASGSTSVTIGNAAGDEAFMAYTAAGTVLFTRVTTGNTNADLFVWNGTSATQLTNQDTAGQRYDHTVVGSFAATL